MLKESAISFQVANETMWISFEAKYQFNCWCTMKVIQLLHFSASWVLEIAALAAHNADCLGQFLEYDTKSDCQLLVCRY